MATFGANLHPLIRISKTGAIVAGVLLTVGAFAVGYLRSRGGRSPVLGLGTAQGNIAAAMVLSSFTNPDVLLMATAYRLGRKRGPRVGLTTHEAEPVA